MPDNKPTVEPLYEHRVVALVDLLGFTDLTTQSAYDPQFVGMLRSLLSRLTQSGPQWDPEISETIFRQSAHGDRERHEKIIRQLRARDRTTVFSDLVVYSSLADWAGFASVVVSVCRLSLEFLAKGILVRGGIDAGRLLHDEKTLLGPALVEANRLESKVAHAPRIVLSEQALHSLATADDHRRNQPSLRSLLRQDADGLIHLNVLGYMAAEASGLLPVRNELLRSLKGFISRRLELRDLSPAAMEKWRWKAEYFNSTLADEPWLDLDPIAIDLSQ